MVDENNLVFMSFVAEDYSRSAVLRGKLTNSEFILVPSPGIRLLLFLLNYKRNKKLNGRTVVVMSPCHTLVPVLRLTIKCHIVLDAGWPLLDGAISRKIFTSPFWRIKYCKYWVIDFICLKLAEKVAFESDSQRHKSVKQFALNEAKVFTSYTGFAENHLKPTTATENCLLMKVCPKCNDSENKIVLFRGKYNPESGLETILYAANELKVKNIKFVFVTNNLPKECLLPSNSILIQDFITSDQMRHLYEISTLSIGQVSDDIRLSYTIPHKAFEAAFFGTPYLTRDAVGIRELFESTNQAIFYDPEKMTLDTLISYAVDDKFLLERVAKSARVRYDEIASQSVITENFLKNINN